MAVFELLKRETDGRSFAAGDKVFAQGDAGGVFGEMALIDQSPRSASAVAMTPSKVVAVGQKRFTYLVQQTPYFALEIMHVLAERLRRGH